MNLLGAITRLKESVDKIIDLMSLCNKEVNELKTEVRDLRILVMHLNKVPQRIIAENTGLSAGRISQIIKKQLPEVCPVKEQKNEEK